MGSIVTPPCRAYHAPRGRPHRLRAGARLAAAGSALALVLTAGAARAEQRPARLSMGAGWSGAILGPPTHGPMAHLAVLPGGAFGRAGGHAEVRGLGGASPWWVVGGLTYEAAAARPHLAVDLRAEAGVVAPGRIPVAGGGARWHAWIAGPLAVGIDTSAHLWLAGAANTRLVLAGALSLELAH